MFFSDIRQICKEAATYAAGPFTPVYFNVYAKGVYFCQALINGQWHTF